MSKGVIVGVVVAAAVVIGGGVALIAKNGGYKSNQNTTSSTNNMKSMPSGSTTTNTADSQPSATNKVVLQNFAFAPAHITVQKGTTVTWTNNDSATHTVVETDGKAGPNSGDLATGKTYSFTYDTVGTFSYHCSIHPSMNGAVTVTN